MTRIGIILDSTHPAAKASRPGCVQGIAAERTDAQFELVDHPLPHLDNHSAFRPGDHSVAAPDTMLDQVIPWNTAPAPPHRTEVATS
ncbi:hypothetical protein [Streptomyces sp. NPDC091217]|uniref:hypothetical protein n=1 Tax=Streptomyces sp. NPDC091217 TaxID=3365975 RepID=UPI003807E5C4